MATPNSTYIQSILKSGINLENLNIECAKVVNSQGQVVQTIPLKNAKNLASLAGIPKVVTLPVATGATTARILSSSMALAGTSSTAQPQQIQFVQAGLSSSGSSFTIPPGGANTVTVLSQSGILPSSAAAVLASGKPVTISSSALRNVAFALKLATTAGGLPAGTVVTTSTASMPAPPAPAGTLKKRVTVKTADPAATMRGMQQQEIVIGGDVMGDPGAIHTVYGRPSTPTPRTPSAPDLSFLVGGASPSGDHGGAGYSRDILGKAIAAIEGPARGSKHPPAKASPAKKGFACTILDHSGAARRKRELDDAADAADAKRRKQDKGNSKGLRHFSMRVCQKVQKKKTTTYNEVADELVVELSDPQSSNVDQRFEQKNIRRRVYDALNVLMAMGMIAKEKKEIRWLGLPSCSDNSYKKLLEEKENLMRSNLQKRQTLYELLLQIICFKNLVAKNKERTSKENVVTGESLTDPEIPDTIMPGTKNRLPVPFLVISTPRDTVIDCNMSQDRSEYLLSFSDAFELSDDFVILKQMGLAHGLENCDATEEQIEQALPHIPPAFHQILREIAKAPPVPSEMLTNPATDANAGAGPSGVDDGSVGGGGDEEESILDFRGITPSPPPGDYFEENEKMDPSWWSKSKPGPSGSQPGGSGAGPSTSYHFDDDDDDDSSMM